MKNIKIEFLNGLMIAVLLGFYFFMIDKMGYSDNSFLRLFNGVFVFMGVNSTIKYKFLDRKVNYLQGFGSAIITSTIGVTVAVIGLFIYVNLMHDAEYLQNLSTLLIGGANDITIGQYCIALFIEGFTSGIIVSFVCMQYWKNATINSTSVSH